MIVDDVNIIRELIDVRENYKSINVLTMCDVEFMIESMFINQIMYNSCKICFYTIILLCVNKEYYILTNKIKTVGVPEVCNEKTATHLLPS